MMTDDSILSTTAEGQNRQQPMINVTDFGACHQQTLPASKGGSITARNSCKKLLRNIMSNSSTPNASKQQKY